MARFVVVFCVLPVITHGAYLDKTHAQDQRRGSRALMRSVSGDTPAASDGETISVVLPCLNETTNMINTVRSFCERTPSDVLQEILVVDDGSSPPLADLIQKEIDEKCRARVLRHETAQGLMVAKQTGGDAAAGKYIGFFDCHVAPNKGWHKEIIQLLQEKPERLVVPQIGDLNMSSWDQKEHGALTAKCYVTLNADFWWYDDESDYMPAISGGLVATSQKWWKESGGYERGMHGWGGENSDQSLRAWLCGGDIRRAKSSIVAHMWRTGDPKTKAHYRVSNIQTDNQERVAASWFDEFAQVFRGGASLMDVNVTDVLERKKALHCKPFAHFLHRFRKIYRDGGFLPETAFKLKSTTGNCIYRFGDHYRLGACEGASRFNLANWVPWNLELPSSSLIAKRSNATEVNCGGNSAMGCHNCPQGHGESWCNGQCKWFWGECVDREEKRELTQRRSSGPKRYSGIREFRALECFDSLDDRGPLAYSCDISGYNQNQQYVLDEQGRIRHHSGRCVGTNDAGTRLQAVPCDDATAKWTQVDVMEPLETKLYREAVAKYGLTEDGPDH